MERLFLYPELITSFLYKVTGSQVGPFNSLTSVLKALTTAGHVPVFPGHRGAHLLLCGSRVRPPGRVRHRPVCVQLGDFDNMQITS